MAYVLNPRFFALAPTPYTVHCFCLKQKLISEFWFPSLQEHQVLTYMLVYSLRAYKTQAASICAYYLLRGSSICMVLNGPDMPPRSWLTFLLNIILLLGLCMFGNFSFYFVATSIHEALVCCIVTWDRFKLAMWISSDVLWSCDLRSSWYGTVVIVLLVLVLTWYSEYYRYCTICIQSISLESRLLRTYYR